MDSWQIQQQVEGWCRNAWNSLGMQQIKNDLQRVLQEISQVRQEMQNARTASTTALSQAKKAVADAEKIVTDVADRMDDLEDEQAKFSEVIKEAKEKSDEALEESKKKNQPIIIKTGEGWDYGGGQWTTQVFNAQYGHIAYTIDNAVNIAAQLESQGVSMSSHILAQMMAELDSAKDKLVVEQDNYNKKLQEAKDANN